MSILLESIISMRELTRSRSFEAATRNPAGAQAELLRGLMAHNANTAFGRAHGFSRIATAADYARAVPITDYEALRPFVNRIIGGEKRVLTADEPYMFTATSGTTGEPKLLPVTTRWREQMAALTRLWLVHAMRDHPQCLENKALTIVSPAIEGETDTRMPYGAMSGVTYQRIPWLIRRHYVLPYAVSLIADCETRYFLTMRLAMAERVSMIGTPNPSTLIRLARTAEENAERIIRAIHDGTLGVEQPQIRAHRGITEQDAIAAIRAATRPDPARARELQNAVARDGRLLPSGAWPELRLIGCWLGGSVGFQAGQLAEYYGDVPRRDLGLWASEGRMTIPTEDETSSGVLAIGTSFYEFVPEESIEEGDPPIMLAHQLERGQRYYILISGQNGLYRYDMNDIVEVTGSYNRTPLIAFVRKGRDMASITGEKIHVQQLQAAIRAAEGCNRSLVRQFRAIPDVKKSRYDLLVEFAVSQNGSLDEDRFIRDFDKALAKMNIEYASKRESQRLRSPRLCVMRHRWSDRITAADFKSGKREAQYKWRQLVQEWDAISIREVISYAPKGG
jgi:GH3 auxin-responsive promoter